jgi:ABC-type transport system involved in cytochrome c biogenesis permease subunit
MNSQELNSIMLYIHPPLAIIGFALVFLFAILLVQKKNIQKRKTQLTGLSLWIFTFLGLFTGMLWAQMAWGSYWSWDPKETMTLVLFLTVSVSQTAYFEKKFAAAKWIAVLACILTILTASSSFIIAGLHSYS